MSIRRCYGAVLGVFAAAGVTGCIDADDNFGGDAIASRSGEGLAEVGDGPVCAPSQRVQRVRALLQENGVTTIPAPPAVPAAQVELGRALFFDKVLSGTRDVACATCHHPARGTADGRPLFSGIGGEGVGLAREGGVLGGRHSQHVYNLHLHRDLTIDGKVELRDGQFLALGLPLIPTHLQAQFHYGVVSAQAIMPIVTAIEMLGFPGENDLSDCPPLDLTCSWDGVMARLGEIPEYVEMFEAAFPGQDFEAMTIAHVGDAIAAFELQTFFFDDSPFDRFLRGDDCALSKLELAGAERFYAADQGNCVACHAGAAMTDREYHKLPTPQFGPGHSIPAGDGPDELDDFGRMRNTGDPADKYAWRTPPLRNVDRTGPFGRLGQYTALEDLVARYRDVEAAVVEYDITQLELPALWTTRLDNVEEVLASGIDPLLGDVRVKGKGHVKQLVAFLRALTDPRAASLLGVIPESVPSGLPVDHATDDAYAGYGVYE